MLAVTLLAGLSIASVISASPAHDKKGKGADYNKFYDVQGHRGGRGNTVENTLPSFAWGLIYGSTSLELDNGLTKDGHVVVWHDEDIEATKCSDTKPAFPNDPQFPYVGKYIANLTLAQIKTLDCGSKRLYNFPFQLKYPGTKISTLPEFFDFVDCATDEKILLNIESKVDPLYPNLTRSASDFVAAQVPLFKKSGRLAQITYQSFDWRTIIESKKILPELVTSALADDTTLYLNANNTGVSVWLGGVDISKFNGTDDVKLAEAAASINADILSPGSEATTSNTTAPTEPGYVEFTTAAMIKRAHQLGLSVKPYTIDDLTRVEQLYSYGADGIISDNPDKVRRWFEYTAQRPVAPLGDKDRILKCLKKHNQIAKA